MIGLKRIMSLAAVALAVACNDSELLPTDPASDAAGTTAVAASPALSIGVGASGETIATDQNDYAPGEVVTITGTGWAPGESVRLVLAESPEGHGPREWDVQADEQGNFTDTSFSPEEHHLGVTFTLTATGLSSGRSAQTTFTDGRFFSATITPTGVLQNSATVHMLTITNLASPSLGSLRILKPSNYNNFSTSPCAAVAPSGWTIGTGACTSSEIRLTAIVGQALARGQSLTIQVTATGSSTGITTWTIEGWRTGTTDQFQVESPAPTVEISSRPASTTISPTFALVNTQSLYTLTVTNLASTTLRRVRITRNSSDYQDFTTTNGFTCPTVSGWTVACSSSAITLTNATGITNGQSVTVQFTAKTGTATGTKTWNVEGWEIPAASGTAGTNAFGVSNPAVDITNWTATAAFTPTNPASTAPGASATHPLRVTRGSSGDKLGTVRITIPSGFTAVSLGTLTTSPSGRNWTGTIAGGSIVLSANTDSDRLQSSNDWVQVPITATAPTPSSTTSYEWTTSAWWDWESFGGGTYAITGQPSIQVAVAAATTTTVISTANPSAAGQSVTFTATVKSGPAPGTAIGANGAVTFKSGGTTCSDAAALGGPTNLNASGQATFSSSALPAGTTIIRACYGGTTTAPLYAASEGSVSQVVNALTTTTELTADPPSPQTEGTSITFTAAVSSTTTVDAGTVSFYRGGASCTDLTGASPIGTAQNVENGEAEVTTTTLPVGSHTIRACYSGSGAFAASPADLGYTIEAAQVATVLTVAAATGTFGGTTTLSATLTAGGNPVSGKTISFTLNENAVDDAVTNSSGVATLTSVSLNGINAGTYPTGVAATFDGDANFVESSGSNTLTVNQAPQTISFTSTAPNDAKVAGPTYAVSATATSELAVSFSSTTPTICTVLGSTVSFVGAGTCTVAGNQAGNLNYLAATQVTQGFTVAKGTATITLSNLSQVYNGSPKSATATTNPAGLTLVTITYDGSTTAPTDAGEYDVVASLNNANYEATDATGTLVIAQASQSISFTSTVPTNALIGQTYAVSATATSGLTVTFSSLTTGVCTVTGGTVSFVGVGSCTVAADQAGNNNYSAALQKTQTIAIEYVFSGFFAPVDWPTTVNIAKAGQAIPLKWRLTDTNGVGITNLTSVIVKASPYSCGGSTDTDAIEEYAGSSGLQNLGDGYYQFNWKTPAGYANSCKTIGLDFGGYTESPTAIFTFKR